MWPTGPVKHQSARSTSGHVAIEAAARKLIAEREELSLKEGNNPHSDHLQAESIVDGFP